MKNNIDIIVYSCTTLERGDGNILCLTYGNGYMAVYINTNAYYCIFKMDAFY